MNTRTLKPGDRVAYNTSKDYVNLRFDTVERLTKTTVVLAGGHRFNVIGDELKSPMNAYPSGRMWSIEDAEKYEAKRLSDSTTNGDIADILKCIDGNRCGNGSYHISKEDKESLLVLVNALHVNG